MGRGMVDDLDQPLGIVGIEFQNVEVEQVGVLAGAAALGIDQRNGTSEFCCQIEKRVGLSASLGTADGKAQFGVALTAFWKETLPFGLGSAVFCGSCWALLRRASGIIAAVGLDTGCRSSPLT